MGQPILLDRPWPEAPLGLIQLHGAFLFGSCPSRHYAPLLNALLERGYPAVLHRFPLDPRGFDHWSVALDLLLARRDASALIRERHGAAAAAFSEDPANSCWLGHSLGSKFLILLEILSLPDQHCWQVLEESLGENEADRVISLRKSKGLSVSDNVNNQPTLLLAPEVSNTVRILRSNLQLDFGRSLPGRRAVEMLLQQTPNRFGLTAVIAFLSDRLAVDDVELLRRDLCRRQVPPIPVQDLPGGHFEPVGLHVESLANAVSIGFSQLRARLSPSDLGNRG